MIVVSALSPGGIALTNAHMYFICYSPMGFKNASSTGYQSPVIRASIFQMASIKVGVLDMWINSFQRYAGELILLRIKLVGKRGEVPTNCPGFWRE